jgi:Icc-related predicted phosphoesterase
MRFVCLSDTHKRHKEVSVPCGDFLLGTGDYCGGGSVKSMRKFADWFASHSHKYKVMVAGNHDRCMEQGERLLVKDYIKGLGIIYLEHEPETIAGLKFFGSPFQPEFNHWAFNVPRGEMLKRKWAMIPDDTEVLLTHGPPHTIGDYYNGINHGCEELYQRCAELKNLKLHVFGHIHDDYGAIEICGTTFVNAAICDEQYEPSREPIVIDL